jgi:chromate transporter
LQLVAVAVVANAVLAMQQRLAPDRTRMAFAILATAIVLFTPQTLATPLAIVLGALGGLLFLWQTHETDTRPLLAILSARIGATAAAIFAVLFVICLFFQRSALSLRSLFAAFFRTGSLVFGGGHVVLPLLNGVVVARGWISQQAFLAGYGAAQALPGPLFSFAAYIGTATPTAHPLAAGLVALIAIFLPGLLLIAAILPFWQALRQRILIQSALRGVNASVVGVLIAALYQPVWTSAVHSSTDFWIALTAFAALTLWKVQPWIVVVAVGACFWLSAL